jgi:phosphoribosylformylglycinamidine (FGAM) synthase-like amidotransferase family enzyme
MKAYVISGYGFNSDAELAEAFTLAGADARRVHISDVLERPSLIHDAGILGFPGGFSFGDHLGSGKEIANLLRKYAKEELERFVASGKPLIGICNGFQVLAKLGIVPNASGAWESEASLIHNEGGAFIDEWVSVEAEAGSPCVWTKGLPPLELPIRHGEGRFVAKDEATLDSLEKRGLVALRYAGSNPNGSSRSIAGVTDPSGLVLGLMPHPECFLWPEHHPRWRRERVLRTGLEIFKRGVASARGS